MTLDKICSKCYLTHSISNKWYKASKFGLAKTPDSRICKTCASAIYNQRRREAKSKAQLMEKMQMENDSIRQQLVTMYKQYPDAFKPSTAYHGVG